MAMWISDTCYVCGGEVKRYCMGDHDLDNYGVVNVYDGNNREQYHLCCCCVQEIVEYMENLRKDYNE